MARLLPAILGLRRDPRILKLPPYLSFLCILVGIAWLLFLPLDEYIRNTYISENALLPAQVHAYFGGSEHTVFRAYRHEVHNAIAYDHAGVAGHIESIFTSQGLKVGRQKYHYDTAGISVGGENVYGVLQGPKADATEAIVLIAAWRNMDGVLNQSAVALLLTLARYMKRWSLWSKDIIFVVTSDSIAGPQAWVDAYHDTQGQTVEPLPIRSGALQAAIAVDYPAGPEGHRFEKLQIHYDGINGQLPNLDLVNTVIKIAWDQVGVNSFIQGKFYHKHNYYDRLDTVLQGILTQGRGQSTGPHSAFIPYHVDAVTIQTVGDGWHDEMSLGKMVESCTRSLNNLLEHLHQSFFFYLLLDEKKFVSIGTYLPAAMLIAVNFTITSIAMWVFSGRSEATPKPVQQELKESKAAEAKDVIQKGDETVAVPHKMLQVDERRLFTPVILVAASHLIGLLPLYMLHSAKQEDIVTTFASLAVGAAILPYIAAFALRSITTQELTLISCFSLLLLGVALATLSTLNFSLGLLIGLCSVPASFVRPLKGLPALSAAVSVAMQLVSPAAAIVLIIAIPNGTWTRGYAAVEWKLREAMMSSMLAWVVNGTWTNVVICLVWWPSWFIATFISASGIFRRA